MYWMKSFRSPPKLNTPGVRDASTVYRMGRFFPGSVFPSFTIRIDWTNLFRSSSSSRLKQALGLGPRGHLPEAAKGRIEKRHFGLHRYSTGEDSGTQRQPDRSKPCS